MQSDRVTVRVHKVRIERYGFMQVVLKAEHGDETYHQATINHQNGHKFELYIATNGTSEMLSATTMRQAYKLGHRAIRLMHRDCCSNILRTNVPFWHPKQCELRNIRQLLEGSRYAS